MPFVSRLSLQLTTTSNHYQDAYYSSRYGHLPCFNPRSGAELVSIATTMAVTEATTNTTAGATTTTVTTTVVVHLGGGGDGCDEIGGALAAWT